MSLARGEGGTRRKLASDGYRRQAFHRSPAEERTGPALGFLWSFRNRKQGWSANYRFYLLNSTDFVTAYM